MTEYQPSLGVQRVLARDDLLMMAADADEAVGIVRQREALPQLSINEQSLFEAALKAHLEIAEDEREQWAPRALSWRHAGVIVRFCDLVGIPAKLSDRVLASDDFLRRSMRLVEDDNDPAKPPKNLAMHAFHRYRAARDLRLLGRFDEALRLTGVDQSALNASGAEPHNAYLLYELGIVYLREGQANLVPYLLREWNSYWNKTRAAGYDTRHRVDFISAISLWDDEGPTDRTLQALDIALKRVRHEIVPDFEEVSSRPRPEPGIEELSVTLAKAELLAGVSPLAD